MPRKRKTPVVRFAFRDPKTGRFTKPKGRKRLVREEYVSAAGRLSKKLTQDVGTFKSPPKQRMPSAERAKRLVWEGSNQGRRFDDMLAEGRVLHLIEARNARRVVVEVEAWFPGGTIPIRRSIEMLLASKGKGRRIKNRKVLLLALIHATDGTGLKMYAAKFMDKRDRKRLYQADRKRSNVRIWALTSKKRYLPSEGFEETEVTKGVKIGRKKKLRYKADKESTKRRIRRT